jgi:dTDP-4-dehydrorhamnose reductase
MMIGILGASGLIGYHLYCFLKMNGLPAVGSYLSKKKEGLVKLDLLTDSFSVFDRCTTVVIAAGITDIDGCFRHKEEAYRCNVEKTIAFIRYLDERKIKPVFLSSDQVFDGIRGNYAETDQPDPQNYYGNFKLLVEQFIGNNIQRYLILRLSKTYSTNPADGGMYAEIYKKLACGKKVRAAFDQIYNPTDVEIICNGISHSMTSDLQGVYHLADKTIMSRYEFALRIAAEHHFERDLIEKIDFNSLGLPEKRALNSSLNVDKFNKTRAPA